MKGPFIIVLDQGSSSSRALAFDTEGNVRYSARKKAPIVYPRPGLAEYDGMDLLRSQTDSLKEVLAKLPEGSSVKALGLAAQRSTVALWDRETGVPFCPVLSWQDGRAQGELAGVPLSNTAVHELTGLYKTPYYSAPKIKWCLRNCTEAAAAAASGSLMVSPVSGFILWHLSGGKTFLLDPAQAQRTLLFNIKRMKWEPRLMGAFGLSAKYLPAVRPAVGDFGRIKCGGFDIPVRAMMGDQQAALLGLGAASESSAALNYGTGAFLMVNTGTKVVKVRGLLNSIGWQEAGMKAPCHFLESTVNSAASALEWLKQKLGLFGDLSEVDGMCRLSRNRVYCLPAIGGLGSPHWDFSAFTTFTGLQPHTDKNDIVRGMVEGIAYMVGDAFDMVRKKGYGISEIRASGGLSNIDWLLQFQADITGAKVLRMQDSEATALGAAIAAAGAAGITMPVRAEAAREFVPATSGEERAAMLKGWRGFVKCARKSSSDLRGLGVLPHA